MDPEIQATQPGFAKRAALGAGLLVLVLIATLVATRGGTEPTRTAIPLPSPSTSGAPPAASGVPGIGTLFGVSLPRGQANGQAAALDRLKQQFGGLPVARVFAPGLPSPTWADDPTLAALGSGTAVVYSFRGDPVAAAAGQFDAEVSALLASRPPGVKVWMAFYHEPEDQVANGVFTAEQFRGATAHLAPVIRSGGAIPTSILQEYTLQPASGRNWRDFFSPTIDLLAWDAYNVEAKRGTPTYKPAEQFVAPVLAVAKETSKPFAWAEFGSPCISTDPSCARRADWLHSVGQAFRDSGALFATYWNRKTTDGSIDYSLSDGPSIAAFRKLVSG